MPDTPERTRKIQLYLTIGFANANWDEEIEVPADATDEEIDEITREWAFNYIEYSWSPSDA